MPTSARCEMFPFLGIRGDVGIAPYKITFLCRNPVYFVEFSFVTAVVALFFSESIFSACIPRITTPPMKKNKMLKVCRLMAYCGYSSVVGHMKTE